METIAKFTHHSYKRKICIEDREKIVVLYEEGYAISRIARAMNPPVATHSIRHHLMAMGVLEKDRKIKRWGEDAKLSPAGDIDKAIDKRLPLHIQVIYKKMYTEDEEMRNRMKPRAIARRRKSFQHKLVLADDPREFDKKPFKAAYSFTL